MSEAVKLEGRQLNLKERQALEAYKKNFYPQHQKQVTDAAGVPFQFEITWEQFMAPDHLSYFNDSMEKCVFNVLAYGFKEICSDDMGKQAVKNSIKKVVLKNTRDSYNAEGSFTLKDGVLTYDINPHANHDYWREKATCFVSYLGDNL